MHSKKLKQTRVGNIFICYSSKKGNIAGMLKSSSIAFFTTKATLAKGVGNIISRRHSEPNKSTVSTLFGSIETGSGSAVDSTSHSESYLLGSDLGYTNPLPVSLAIELNSTISMALPGNEPSAGILFNDTLGQGGGNYASGISQESEVKLDASIIPDTTSPLLSSAYPNLNLGVGLALLSITQLLAHRIGG